MRIEELRIGQGVVVETVAIVSEIHKSGSVYLETKQGQIIVKAEHLTILKEAG